mgnify:CR=1 FL=1
MTAECPILTETHGRVGLIRLNRPAQLNALNDELMDALDAGAIDFAFFAKQVGQRKVKLNSVCID